MMFQELKEFYLAHYPAPMGPSYAVKITHKSWSYLRLYIIVKLSTTVSWFLIRCFDRSIQWNTDPWVRDYKELECLISNLQRKYVHRLTKKNKPSISSERLAYFLSCSLNNVFLVADFIEIWSFISCSSFKVVLTWSILEFKSAILFSKSCIFIFWISVFSWSWEILSRSWMSHDIYKKWVFHMRSQLCDFRFKANRINPISAIY